MTVLRTDRFTIDPGQGEELLRRRNALLAAVRAALPGPTEARLTREDDRTWVDHWRWQSPADAQAAVELARSGALPEAGAVFELATDVTTTFLEVLDER